MDSRPAVFLLISQNVVYRGLPCQPLGDIYVELQPTSLKLLSTVNLNHKKICSEPLKILSL